MQNNFWTLPNILTLMRLCFGSPSVIFLHFNGHHYAASIIFLCFVGSDWLDGFISRALRIGSKWGKRWDPIADQALVLPIFWYFAAFGAFGGIFVIAAIVLTLREAVMWHIRSVAVKLGRDVSSHRLGKIKISLEYASLAFLLIGSDTGNLWGILLLVLAIYFSYRSLVYYLIVYDYNSDQ